MPPLEDRAIDIRQGSEFRMRSSAQSRVVAFEEQGNSIKQERNRRNEPFIVRNMDHGPAIIGTYGKPQNLDDKAGVARAIMVLRSAAPHRRKRSWSSSATNSCPRNMGHSPWCGMRNVLSRLVLISQLFQIISFL